MALLLLAEALLEEAPQLLGVDGLERGEILGAELAARLRVLEPLLELVQDLHAGDLDPAGSGGERLVERVEVLLAVDEERTRDVVKALERAIVEALHEGARERHGLLRADLHLARAKLVEKRHERRAHSDEPWPQRALPSVRAMTS